MRLVQLLSTLFAAGLANSQNEDGTLFGASSPPFYPSPWIEGTGNWADAYDKAQSFVRQLTLLEKVNLTTGVGWQSGPCVGNTGSIPRLDFRSLCLQDSPLGIRLSDYNSVFPAGVTVAASFDRGIWYNRGSLMAAEFRDKGIDIQLGPSIGPLGRVPAGGRNWEGFSPDPYLTGIAVANTVRGIQDNGVVATTKHYIMNEQEHFRQAAEAQTYGFEIEENLSSNVDDVTMHETYLWPFAEAVRAGTGAIMAAFNQVNNTNACENSYLNNYLLKGELGFQGFLMSDWAAQHHGLASAFAGLDMIMPGGTYFNSNVSYWGSCLTAAVADEVIPEWRLDDMVTRIMAAFYYVRRDESQIPVNFHSWSREEYGYEHAIAEEGYGLINERVNVRGDHTQHIRDQAARSTVLLKNTLNVLPLSGKEKFTAVFGKDAAMSPYGANGYSDRGGSSGTAAIGWGSGTANFPFLISPLTAIQNEVVKNNGIIQSVTDNWALDQVTELATQADVSIVFINAFSGEGYISIEYNNGDRNNLTAWHNGENLISEVSASCENTIVVVHSPGVVMMDSFYDNPNVKAIIWAGLPGEQSGNSITDILYGRVNPGAKLPFTIGYSRDDYGTDVLYQPNNGKLAPQDNFVEGNFIDYRAFDKENIEPIYEFGFGLSYTEFSYSNLQIKKQEVDPYVPTTGMTNQAPEFRGHSSDLSDYLFPENFTQIPYYLYPWLSSENETCYEIDYIIPDGATDGAPQERIAASGAPGGNPSLWDVLYTVQATITNIGDVIGDEVVQLYVSLGGDKDPVRVLRGFDRLTLAPGESGIFEAELTRKDISNWDPVSQNWIISEFKKTIYVGSSSRNLILEQEIDSSFTRC